MHRALTCIVSKDVINNINEFSKMNSFFSLGTINISTESCSVVRCLAVLFSAE